MKTSITISIDSELLSGYTDEYITCLWHAAQAAPAEYGDRTTSELVRALEIEIVRRYLAAQQAPLFNHQSHDHLRLNATLAREASASSPVAES